MGVPATRYARSGDLQIAYAVISAVGSEHPVLASMLEGCGLTALYAASHPDLVRALILISPQPRLVTGAGYEWAPSVEQRALIVDAIVESWGQDSPENPFAVLFGGQDQRLRGSWARLQRFAMSPAAAVVFDAPLVSTSTAQCQNGGWRNFSQFTNHRQCVAFVKQQARISCLAERAKIGRVSFRVKYGKGRGHRHAMRRCVKRAVRGAPGTIATST